MISRTNTSYMDITTEPSRHNSAYNEHVGECRWKYT